MFRQLVNPAETPILEHFNPDDLPDHLQPFGEPLDIIAHGMVASLHPSAELSAGLRKLLEAKDCFLRAAVSDKRKHDARKNS